jgi:hypothetical protein
MKLARSFTLCSVLLGLVVLFAVVGVGSASAAKTLLFESSSGFPYHMAGTGGASKFETVGGGAVTSTSSDVLAQILNKTLFDLHILYLGFKTGTTACSNTSNSEGVLINLLGHLGLADPGDKPAVLLLVPTGFEYKCGLVVIKERGAYIGEITKPALLISGQKEMTLKFEQAKGVQKYTEFLLGGGTLDKGQFLELSLDGFPFEQTGREGEMTLKATGAGTFELKDD